MRQCFTLFSRDFWPLESGSVPLALLVLGVANKHCTGEVLVTWYGDCWPAVRLPVLLLQDSVYSTERLQPGGEKWPSTSLWERLFLWSCAMSSGIFQLWGALIRMVVSVEKKISEKEVTVVKKPVPHYGWFLGKYFVWTANFLEIIGSFEKIHFFGFTRSRFFLVACNFINHRAHTIGLIAVDSAWWFSGVQLTTEVLVLTLRKHGIHLF